MRAAKHITRKPGETLEAFEKRRKSIYNKRYRDWHYHHYRVIKERYRKKNLHRWRAYSRKYHRKLKKRG